MIKVETIESTVGKIGKGDAFQTKDGFIFYVTYTNRDGDYQVIDFQRHEVYTRYRDLETLNKHFLPSTVRIFKEMKLQ